MYWQGTLATQETKDMPDCCSNSPGIPRRNFLKIGATTAAAGIMGVGLPVLISADEDDTSAHLIPADKKLTPAQLRAMCERGEPEWHEGDELTYVGMPVGGIGCGQLYIGGDGRLWHWDIFRPWYDSPYISSPYGALSSGHHYANPPTPDDPVQQPLQHGFALRIRQGDDETVRSLSADGFRKIRFRGEYPISRVEYRETFLPVEVDLEAFSPFIPLNADDSGLPCTLLNYTLRNTSDQPASVDLAGWMENAVCPEETRARVGRRRISFGKGRLTCSAHEPLDQALAQPRPPILIADFEGDDYGDWTVEGEAFGDHPFRKDELEDFDQLQGIVGEGLVNTHETRASGGDPAAADNFTGTLTSPEFEIERHYIVFKVGGGHPRKEARIELLIDGVPVASEAGGSDLLLRPAAFDVYDFEGKTAQIRIVDAVEGGWGHVAVDHITMEDVPPGPPEALDELPGFGTMALRMLGANRLRTAVVDVAEGAQAAFAALDERGKGQEPAETAFDARPAGAVGGSVTLGPGEERRVTFLLAWHFPHYRQIRGEMGSVIDLASLKRHYAARFADADAVADYVVAEFDRLAETTRLWNATWYDSTLPHWLLDRSFVSLNCLATTTLHWFDSGRVWGWEGTDCCPGTCQHVWNYAQGMARIFPELERSLRTVTDYGISFREDGALDYRGESSRMVAHDGQAGTIMRAWREHAISADDSFLRPIWPRVKKSVEYLMALDPDRNGILDCTQYNTLDAAWEGPMAWISSLYLGAVAAGAAMADDMGDADFAEACRAVVATGGKTLVDELYDGEYFIHKPDDGYEATNTNDGCHIDQVLGQSWAIQLGLERVVPESETGSALRSLWKYNFALDAGG